MFQLGNHVTRLGNEVVVKNPVEFLAVQPVESHSMGGSGPTANEAAF